MSPPNTFAQSSTLSRGAAAVAGAPFANEEEDLALGWECANPALQIEAWAAEAAAQPLQKFN